MKRKYFFSILTFCLILACSLFSSNQLNTLFANTIQSSVMYNNMVSDYYNLENVTSFDVVTTTQNSNTYNTYYLLDNENVNSYNDNTKYITTLLTSVTGATDIWVKDNILFVQVSSDIKMYDLNDELSVISTISNVTSFDVIKKSNNLVVAYIQNNVLYVDNFDTTTFELSNINNVSLVGSYYITITPNNVYALNKTTYENSFYKYDYTLDTLSNYSNPEVNPINKNGLFSYSTDSNEYVSILIGESIRSIDTSLLGNSTINYSNQICHYAKLLKQSSNNIYCLDTIKNYIYSWQKGTFTNITNVCLGSFGSELGRYSKTTNSFAIKDDTLLAISDYGNSRIIVINNGVISTFLTDIKAQSLCFDEYSNLYFCVQNATSTTIYSYSIDGTKLIDTTVNCLVHSFALDNQNQLYVLDYQNAKVLKMSESNSVYSFADYKIDLPHVNNSSKLSYINKTNNFVITTDNNFDVYGNTINNITTSSNITDYVIDYSGIAYALLNNGDLIKLDLTASTPTIETNNGYNNTNVISINQVSGKLYLFNNNLCAIKTITDTDFSSGLTNFEHYNSTISSSTPNATIVNYATLSPNSLIFEYPNFAGKVYNLDNSISKVLLLQDSADIVEGGFVYVMFVENNNARCGYVNYSNVTINANVFTQNSKILYAREQNVELYKFPTIHYNVTISTLSIGNKITSFCAYPISIDGINYYVTKVDGGYAYINAIDTLLYSPVIDRELLDSNATIKVNDYSTFAQVYEQANQTNLIDALGNNTKIYVESYDKNSEYTQIKYIDSNQEEHTGFILTKYVKLNSDNTMLIAATITLCSGIILAIILIICFTNYKKKHS